jgi:hypothetical protein
MTIVMGISFCHVIGKHVFKVCTNFLSLWILWMGMFNVFAFRCYFYQLSLNICARVYG